MNKSEAQHDLHSGDTTIERIAIRMRKELEDTRHRYDAPSASDSDGHSSLPRKDSDATPAQTWWLVITEGGRPFQVKLSKSVAVIGRHPSCDLRVPAQSVSRFHCKITIQGDRLHVEDLQSRNGTHHNDRRILESDVASGERITIGPVTFRAMLVRPDLMPDESASESRNDGDETSFGEPSIS